MTPPAVQLNGLSRRFGSICALDRLTLEIPQGIIFGLLGPNGAGKTTTIRLLLGLLEPTAGRAVVLGYDVRTNAAMVRNRTGALLEHCGLYERLSAADNLDLYGRFWRIAPAERRARARELLTHLALWHRRAEAVAGWSRGMKQKLAIARALLHRPELVLLDEPTAGLDPTAAMALREDLARLSASEGITIVLTTHNLPEAERLCALVGVVRAGRLLAVAPPAEIGVAGEGVRIEITGSGLTDAMLALVRAHPGVRAVQAKGRRVGVDLRRSADVPSVVTMLVGAGFELESLRSGAGSLEHAFHALMGSES